MKIGILTWYFGINYGARAHSLALMNIIKGMGHECEFLNYRSNNNWKIELRTCCPTSNLKAHPIILSKGLVKWFKFRRQLQKYPQSRRIKNVSEISGYDTVIVGSDEILNLNHLLNNKSYYGVGIPETIPLIMYAASSGTVQPNKRLTNEMREALNRFIGLSVRDDSTEKLIYNNTSIHPKLVLDPTLLYDFGSERRRMHSKNYILIYSFGTLDSIRDQIVSFARGKQIDVVCVGRVCDWANRSYATADLEEWLNLYQFADYIVTDSYHGLIFAIKYEKEFILVSRGDKTNKIDGLRRILQIERNAYNPQEDIGEYLSGRIDYRIINMKIRNEVRNSIDYLETNINAIEEKRKCRT